MSLEPEEDVQAPTDDGSAGGWLANTFSATLLLLIFMIGLFVGFAGRPFLDTMAGLDARTQAAAGAIGIESGAQAPGAVAAPQAGAPALASTDFVVSNVRHFLGDPEAPVTLIEFSDFQ